jgi:hypothetical protein
LSPKPIALRGAFEARTSQCIAAVLTPFTLAADVVLVPLAMTGSTILWVPMVLFDHGAG